MDAFLTNLPSQSSETKSQEPQRSSPTVTPPIKTPPPQETGKQADLQGQQRPGSQVYYQAGVGQQASKSLNHRGDQGGSGVKPTAMYPHHSNLPVPPGTLYMQGQVPFHPSHAAPYQQPVYAMNSQMQPIQPRQQGHQNQSFYPSYQPTIVPNIFGYAPGPTTQHGGYFYTPQGPPLNMSRAGAGAVTGGTPHVGSPSAAGQAGTVVPQGSIQQPSQQPQPMLPMSIQLGPTDFQTAQDSHINYSSSGAGAVGHTTSHTGSSLPEGVSDFRVRRRRLKAPMNIVDPKTGKYIGSDQIYQSHDNQAAPTPQKSESIFGDSISSCGSSNGLLSMEQIYEKLISLMSNEKENSLENICGWISKNVSKRVRDPGFINVLMTAILVASIEPYNNAWQFRVYKFQNLQGLITRYIDVGIKMSELQCLIAIQEYIHQLDTSQRVLLQVIEKQLIESILSVDLSRASGSNKASSTHVGRSAAMIALKSFFTALNEANDESSYE